MFSLWPQKNPAPIPPHDVRLMFLKDQTIGTLALCRSVCKGFRYTVDTIIAEKFKDFLASPNHPISQNEFETIKRLLSKQKDHSFCAGKILQIRIPQIRAVVALIFASTNYNLWNPKNFREPFNYQKNLVDLNDLLVMRRAYSKAIQYFNKDEPVCKWLEENLLDRSKKVQEFIKFSSDDWTKETHHNIGKLVNSIPEGSRSHTDIFYNAIYHLYIKKGGNTEEALKLLKGNANKGDRNSQYIYGEYLMNEACQPFDEAAIYFAQAAVDNPYFAYRYAMDAYYRDKERYRQHITRYIQEACTANLPLAFHGYGIMYRDNYFNTADHLNTACNYFIKAIELGYTPAEAELKKISSLNKPEPGCLVQ